MGVFWPIIKNENVKFGIYNSQIKNVKKRYQENQGWYLLFSTRTGVIYRLHDYFQLVQIGSKFPLGLSNPWWILSSVWHNEIFTCNRHSIFTLVSLTIQKEISLRFKAVKFQSGSPPTPLASLFFKEKSTKEYW